MGQSFGLDEIARPTPPGSRDSARWAHSAMRRRMLEGLWEADLRRELAKHFPLNRLRQQGVPQKASNVFKSVTWQMGVLYDRWPTLTHDDQEKVDPLIGVDGLMASAGLWPLMSRFQKNVIGVREYLMYVSASKDEGKLLYQPVGPDEVIVEASPDCPDVPIKIAWARLRLSKKTAKYMWVWEVYDVTDPKNPSLTIRKPHNDGSPGEDSTLEFRDGALSGDDYPWKRADGNGVLPWVLYHAEKTGMLFDPWEGLEVVHGSLTLAVLWTFFVHCLRDASWPQRYGVNVIPVGLETRNADDSKVQQIEVDPSTVVFFKVADPEAGQAIVDQWDPGSDVEKLEEAISKFEARLVQFTGVSPADIQRTGGDPRSGYAIAISREGQREAQRRFEPQFREGDIALTEVSAIISNRILGTNFPETGYRIRYEAIPLSAQERESQRTDLTEKIAAGLISPVDAYRELNPGVTDAEAEAALTRIAEARRKFNIV